jgi:hypothetical protein
MLSTDDLIIAILTSALFLTLMASSQLVYSAYKLKRMNRHLENVLNLKEIGVESLRTLKKPLKINIEKTVNQICLDTYYAREDIRKNIFELMTSMFILLFSSMIVYFLFETDPLFPILLGSFTLPILLLIIHGYNVQTEVERRMNILADWDLNELLSGKNAQNEVELMVRRETTKTKNNKKRPKRSH